MSVASESVSERELRFQEVAAEYLEAREAGRPDELSALLARHPDLADELAAFVAGQDELARLAAPLRDAVAPATPAPERTMPLGTADAPGRLEPTFSDYEVEGELARGGMGVVYRARQRSLNRPVALKVIRAGEWASAEEVRRFRNEAEMVALLDHPNIVPVYEVGEQAGQLYFSMKLAEGGSLAERLGRFRDDPRAAAGLLATVARAVHHAHQRGVLHRDLKPSNILLDAEGRPHVTDFGLARRVEADSNLTQSGAILGTPSYMAPEQAAAQKGAVTTATDVYGLGAVLYALLTGRPPFQAENVLETLVQVREREPEPPSGVNRRVPRDLGTICLKCLAKEPQRRYESALALAEDLERFLAGQPIQARPVGVWERGVKWAGRHRPLVGAALAALCVALVGLTVATALLARQEGATRAAYAEEARQRQRADVRSRQAWQAVDDMYTQVAERWLENQPQMEPVQKEFLEKALRFYEEFTRENEGDPAVQRERGVAYRRMGDMYWKLGQLERASDYYHQSVDCLRALPADAAGSSAGRRELAFSLMQQGFPLPVFGRTAEATAVTQEAIEIFQALVPESPAEWDNRQALAHCYNNLANYLELLGRPRDAEAAYHEAIGVGKRLIKDFPAQHPSRDELGRSYLDLGELLLAAGRAKEAEECLRESLRLREELTSQYPELPVYQRQRTRSLLAVGAWLRDSGRPGEAQEMYQKARITAERLVKDFPLVPDYQYELARAFARLARLQEDCADWRSATPLMRQAVDHQRLAETGYSDHRYYRAIYRSYRSSLVNLLVKLGEHQELARMAEESLPGATGDGRPNSPDLILLSRCVELARQDTRLEAAERERLAQGHLQRVRTFLDKMACEPATDPKDLNSLAWFLATTPLPEFREPRRAVELARQVTDRAAGNAAYLNTLGVACYRARDWETARTALEKSMQLSGGGDSRDFFFLAMTHWQLGGKEQARQWYERAVAWMDQNNPHDEELLRFRAEAATLLGMGDRPRRPGSSVPCKRRPEL